MTLCLHAAAHPRRMTRNRGDSFLEDLVQAVLVRPRHSVAEDVGPPGLGTDLPWLRQGGHHTSAATGRRAWTA